MQRNATDQVTDFLQKSQSILIALPHTPTLDIVSGAVGLSIFLQKLGKKTEIACSGQLPQNLGFLPQPLPIVSTISQGSSLVIVLHAGTTGLDQLSYTVEGENVKVYLKPKSGSFSPEQVKVMADDRSYDLIVTLGARSLEELGALYQDHAEFFYNAPKVVIDSDAANEYFGAVNLIEVSASGVCEILFELCTAVAEKNIPKEVATSFLAGVISNTHSFQDVHTTPKTLATAAELIQLGADQQSIIVSLFKTKQFPLLKLWGRALARIKTDSELSLLYTALTQQDFEKSETTSEQALAVLREIVENVSGYQIVALLTQNETGGVDAHIAAPPHVLLSELAKSLGSEKVVAAPLEGVFEFISFNITGIDLSQAEQKLMEAVRKLK